jgi:dihydrofolate synthase/folylpolyglutamate synthase
MKMPFWPNPLGFRNIDLGLSRVFALLERLENPHLKLPPTIHLAGTNGKGSTLAFLKAIFNEANLKTHTYTSPHLVNFNERIVLANEEISDDFLNKVLQKCKEACEIKPEIKVTYFEGITAAAFLAFSLVKADILLLETGMGGRLDATNVLPEVLASIITPISFDHQEFLGNTINAIAAEKAGIIKKNCPVILGAQNSEGLLAITKKAQELNSEIIHLNEKFLDFEVALIGSHQKYNAALAATAALAQRKFKISEEQIKTAFKKAKWLARLQEITSGKLHKILNKNQKLFLDGSHNLAGAQTIKEFLQNQEKSRKKILVFAMLQDKDCAGFLAEIKNEIDELIILEIADEIKSRKSNEIKKIAEKLKVKSQISNDFESALKLSKKIDENSLIIICGSLYQAGNFLKQNT